MPKENHIPIKNGNITDSYDGETDKILNKT